MCKDIFASLPQHQQVARRGHKHKEIASQAESHAFNAGNISSTTEMARINEIHTASPDT